MLIFYKFFFYLQTAYVSNTSFFSEFFTLFMELEDFNLNDELIFDNIQEINENITFSKSEFFALHVNIRSIKKNINQLEMMINMLKCKPDVIVCSECWLIDDIKFIDLSGYTCLNNNSRIKKYLMVL